MCNFHKALYGLKHAPKTWNKRNDRFLIKFGFNKCTLENEVYVKGSNEKDQIMLYLYMEDLLVRGSNEDELVKFKASMENEFEMSDLKNLAYFLEKEL